MTTEEAFTFYRVPVLDVNVGAVPKGDYVTVSNAGMYYGVADPSGKLGRTSATVCYAHCPGSPMIELLTERASNVYRFFCAG